MRTGEPRHCDRRHADEETVRRVNLMKGRPAGQISITAPPAAIRHVWDYAELTVGLNRRRVLTLIDTFFTLGPFGFRGPAAAHLPAHLTFPDGPITTTQLIAPGYSCLANDFLARAVHATGDEFLYMTSANRSRHATGAEDSPAHWRADGPVGRVRRRARFPDRRAPGRERRSGPLSAALSDVDDVRAVLDDLGFGLVVGPQAQPRLAPRDYSVQMSDR